ncbi:MAG: hypothetical protein RL708_137 [Bacteroidota bacterium]|jgi:hypothetical protein
MLQYIHDQNGNTSGVFIPMEEWNKLKNQYHIIDEPIDFVIPEWHKKIVLDRIATAKPADYIDADDFFKQLALN